MAVETFYDNTTRADTTAGIGTSTSGTSWTNNHNTTFFGILSNEIYSVAASPNPLSYFSVGSSNCFFSATVSGLPGGTDTLRFLVRLSPGGSSSKGNGYYVSIPSSGQLVFGKYVSGTASSIATIPTYNVSAGDRIGIFISETNIYVFINGSLIYSTTDSSITTGSNVGITREGSSSGLGRVTNVSAGTLPGTYIPPVGSRMAIDRDGTIVKVKGTGTALTTTEVQRLNDELDTNTFAVSGANEGLSILFPEARTVVATFLSTSTSVGIIREYSTNTTTGLDGSWTSLSSTVTPPSSYSTYRTGVVTFIPVANVKGLRFYNGGNATTWQTIHIYGYPQAAAGVHRLAFWHPYLDIPLPGWYLDIDDIGINTTKTRSFRVKNISTSLQANTITVSSEDLTTGSSVSGQLTFTKASLGGVYSSTASITSLASGAISEVLTVKRVTTGVQPLGLQAPRINLAITSFT